MSFKKKIAFGMAVVLAALSLTVSTGVEHVSAASNRTTLKHGVTEKIQLDGKGAKEKICFKMSKKLLSKTSLDRTYQITYQLLIDGKAVVDEQWKKSWSVWEIERTYNDRSFWTAYVIEHKPVIMDIDSSDGVKDIFYATKTNVFRMQYKDGKVIATENLRKMASSLKLPSVVREKWASGDYTCAGTKIECVVPVYKNGDWSYDGKRTEKTIYQFTTTGDGTLNWMICLDVSEVGYLHVTVPLKLKNNKLQLASTSLSGKVLETGCSGAVDKKMTVYTAAGGSSTAYTVNQGDVISFVSYKIINNKVYIQVKNAKGKTGWISNKECDSLYFDGTLHA